MSQSARRLMPLIVLSGAHAWIRYSPPIYDSLTRRAFVHLCDDEQPSMQEELKSASAARLGASLESLLRPEDQEPSQASRERMAEALNTAKEQLAARKAEVGKEAALAELSAEVRANDAAGHTCVESDGAAEEEEEQDSEWLEWAAAHGVSAPKLSVRAPTDAERGKGGVFALQPIAAMEVVARIPRRLVLSASDAARAAASEAREPSWATELTAEALLAVHADGAAAGTRAWVGAWKEGGWATNPTDLGNEEVRWGARDVTGSLIATGSDNDKNIYAKFRFPCHPVVHRAGVGLAALTGTTSARAIDALGVRGRAYRAMRDALLKLVAAPRPTPSGSVRERKAWEVADTVSKVLARATNLELDGVPTSAVVPLHERLAHCDSRGENTKLVGADPTAEHADAAVLLVATREILPGEPLTRDYTLAPRLPDDASDGALRLVLQFGLPPDAWPREES